MKQTNNFIDHPMKYRVIYSSILPITGYFSKWDKTAQALSMSAQPRNGALVVCKGISFPSPREFQKWMHHR